MRLPILITAIICVTIVCDLVAAEFCDIGSGDSSLLVVDDKLLVGKLLDLPKFPTEMDWDVGFGGEVSHISVAGRSGKKHRQYELSCDTTGKDPRVSVAKPNSEGVLKWKMAGEDGKGVTLQTTSGPFKGWYLSPGTEKVETTVDGKMVELGTQPVLSKEPAYFKIHEIAP